MGLTDQPFVADEVIFVVVVQGDGVLRLLIVVIVLPRNHIFTVLFIIAVIVTFVPSIEE